MSPSPEAGAGGYPSAEAVREAYITAYETNSFAPVLKFACPQYVAHYGTDTSALERTLSAYRVTATAVGEAKVRAPSSTREDLQVDLQLRSGSDTSKLSVNVVAEKQSAGEWRFCGES